MIVECDWLSLTFLTIRLVDHWSTRANADVDSTCISIADNSSPWSSKLRRYCKNKKKTTNLWSVLFIKNARGEILPSSFIVLSLSVSFFSRSLAGRGKVVVKWYMTEYLVSRLVVCVCIYLCVRGIVQLKHWMLGMRIIPNSNHFECNYCEWDQTDHWERGHTFLRDLSSWRDQGVVMGCEKDVNVRFFNIVKHKSTTWEMDGSQWWKCFLRVPVLYEISREISCSPMSHREM